MLSRRKGALLSTRRVALFQKSLQLRRHLVLGFGAGLVSHLLAMSYEVEASKPVEKIKYYSTFAGYCFTTNYIIGVGLLGIPYAFVQTGLLLSSLMLLGSTLLLTLTLFWLVESIARVQALDKIHDSNQPVDRDDVSLFVLNDKKFELNQMLAVVLAPWGRYVVAFIMAAFLYVALWSYAAVFASSLLSVIPFPGVSTNLVCDVYASDIPSACETAYSLYMLFFCLLVLPLSCLDIAEQASLQMCLTIFRFVTIGLIVLTSLISLFSSPFDPNVQTDPPYVSYTTLGVASGIPIMFSTSIFSQLLHHSVPGIVHPLRNKSKSRFVFFTSLISTFGLYTLMGIVAALYFGIQAKPVISLNWQSYSGLSFEGQQNANFVARIVAYVIVLFPPIDIVSAYPLNSITLANSIFAALPSRITDNMTNQWIKVFTRFVVVLPPIIFASFIRKLDAIIQIAATMGFFITLIIPATIQICSRRKAHLEIGRSDTPYDTPILSSAPLAWVVLIFGICAFLLQVGIVINLIITGQIS